MTSIYFDWMPCSKVQVCKTLRLGSELAESSSGISRGMRAQSLRQQLSFIAAHIFLSSAEEQHLAFLAISLFLIIIYCSSLLPRINPPVTTYPRNPR